MDYKNFKDTFIDSLNNRVPLKRKYSRANHSIFITKKLRKAIMQKLKLRNLYFKVKETKIYPISLLRKAKRKHYKDPSTADVTDDNGLWKRVKSLFGNKIKGNQILRWLKVVI